MTEYPGNSSITELFNFLEKENCYFDYATTSDSCLHRVFIMWESQALRWLDVGDVACFDTTFHVNDIAMDLSTFTVKNEFGLVEPIGYSLHYNKKTEDYEWTFNQQMEAVHRVTGKTVKPKVSTLGLIG